MRTLSAEQTISIINESGLYSLILRSKKEEAKKFKKWVTHEVLPSIRKTGSFQLFQSSTPAFFNCQAFKRTIAQSYINSS